MAVKKKFRKAIFTPELEAQFLAALLAFGPPPETKTLLDIPKRNKHIDDMTSFVYERMNYTPCKSPAREKTMRTKRIYGIEIALIEWLYKQEAEEKRRQRKNG
jgi:hypothetical protein